MPSAPITWLVEDVISTGGMALLYGRPKVGKSFAALGMAIAITQGHPEWLGFPVRTHGPVAYVQLDVGQALWKDRYLLPVSHHVVNRSRLHIVDRDMAPFPFNLLGAAGAWLKGAIADIKPAPVLVILDTVRRAHIGDENDSGHMQNVMSILADAVSPAALLMVAHARKTAANVPESVLDDNRGSSGLTGAVDTIMKLTSSEPQVRGALLYEGRTDLGQRQLRRDPSGLWLPAVDDRLAVRSVLDRMPHASQNQQAEALARQLGISQRTAVRRIQLYRETH